MSAPEPETVDVELTAEPGETVVLPVGSTAATGYAWRLALPVGVEEVGETSAVVATPGTETGARTGSHLLVRAPEAGTYLIVAGLSRPWEDVPLSTLRIRLRVGPDSPRAP